MNTYVFQAALGEFLRPRRLFVWLLVAFGLGAVSWLFLRVSDGIGQEEAYSLLSSLLTFLVLPLASAIFSSAVLSQEVEQKTIVYLLTRPVPRAQLITMRSVASMVAVAIVSALAAVAVSVAVYRGQAFSNPVLYRDLIAIILGAAAYGSLFVLVSLLVNRAMIVSLLFAFAWETSVPNMPGNMYWLSVSSYLTAIAQRPSAGQVNQIGPLGTIANVLGTNAMPADTGWAVLIGLITFCVGLGAWWFTKFEYLPREDAE